MKIETVAFAMANNFCTREEFFNIHKHLPSLNDDNCISLYPPNNFANLLANSDDLCETTRHIQEKLMALPIGVAVNFVWDYNF